MQDNDGNLVCRQTGERICSSCSLCPGCAHALERLIARMPPPREYTEVEVEQMKVRAGKGKKWVTKAQ